MVTMASPKPSVDFSQLQLRAATKADHDFLQALYRVSRDYELAYSPVPEAQLQPFLDQQFALQTRHFDSHYPQAERQIIELDGKPIGRMFWGKVDDNGRSLRLIDITLLREHRGCGIGKRLVKQLLTHGRQLDLDVTLHVHSLNPAVKLYQSLGFKTVERRNQYIYMQLDAKQTQKH